MLLKLGSKAKHMRRNCCAESGICSAAKVSRFQESHAEHNFLEPLAVHFAELTAVTGHDAHVGGPRQFVAVKKGDVVQAFSRV